MTDLRIVAPEQVGMPLGAWEAHRPEVLRILAGQHNGWAVEDIDGVHCIGRRVPGIGLLRARIYSPEATRADWYRVLPRIRAGHVEVLTNAAAPAPFAPPVSPPDLYSFVVDLRPGAAALFAGFKPQIRAQVRRAERLGASARATQDDRDLAAFHQVLLKVTRGGVVYEAPDLGLFRALLGSGFGRLYVMEHGGRIVGGQFVLVNRYAHCHVLAYDRTACRGLSGAFLYWRVMQGEIDAGMPFLNLGTQSLSMHPGLVTAKSSLSPVLVPAYRYVLAPSRWLSAVDDAWQWVGQRLGPGSAGQRQAESGPDTRLEPALGAASLARNPPPTRAGCAAAGPV